MNRQWQIENLLRAREALSTPCHVSPFTAVDIDLAFAPVPFAMCGMFDAGELTYERAVDWMEKWAGYLVLDMMDIAWDGAHDPLNRERAAKKMRAYYVGKAFVWDVPRVSLKVYNNPFVGHDDVMAGILSGQPDPALIAEYERRYKENGYYNDTAQAVVGAAIAQRRAA